MAVEKWIAGSGVGFTWTTCFPSTDLNSMVNGSSVLSSTGDITNQTALDIFADLSISLGSVTSAAPNYIGVYLFPLNQDGTSYGDGQFVASTQSAAVPGASYYKGSIVVPVGTQVLVGQLDGIIMPPGTFRFLLQNNAGVSLAAAANVVKYRTYNRSIA